MDCGSTDEALKLAGQHKFDLVVSDIELPDGSGFELMKELQRRHGLKGIAVTGLASEGHRSRSLSAGFSFHLKKPVSIRDLENAIAVLSTKSGIVS